MIIVVNNVTDAVSARLRRILAEYSELPEYSGLNVDDVDTRSLFGDYPINIAATRGAIEEMLTLLSAGADIDAKGEHGYTPLHDAVEQGSFDAVKLLLDHGADRSLMNDDGDTPLQLAALLNEEAIQHLLKQS